MLLTVPCPCDGRKLVLLPIVYLLMLTIVLKDDKHESTWTVLHYYLYLQYALSPSSHSWMFSHGKLVFIQSFLWWSVLLFYPHELSHCFIIFSNDFRVSKNIRHSKCNERNVKGLLQKIITLLFMDSIF